MYLALPIELTRAGIPGDAITWFFLLASAVVILFQTAITSWSDRFSPTKTLRLGYLVTAAAFAVIMFVAWMKPFGLVVSVLPIALFVILLHCGSMLVGPRSRDIVARLANNEQLGTYMGALSTMGGIGVLAVSAPIGRLLDPAHFPGLAAMIPWGILMILPLISAAFVSRLLPEDSEPDEENSPAQQISFLPTSANQSPVNADSST